LNSVDSQSTVSRLADSLVVSR